MQHLGMMTETSVEDYEYKFLRSAWSSFSNPVKRETALRHEARYGWTLFEYLDDSRLCLRRPISCRATDASIGGDAYSTQPKLRAK